VGFADDLFRLRPWQKLIGEIVAAAWAYGVGVRVFGFAGYAMENWWSLPLTVFWLVLCANAFNLIDGIDGLAAGLGLFATLTMLVAAIVQKKSASGAGHRPLAGCLLGFLRYNFNPATVFLGDFRKPADRISARLLWRDLDGEDNYLTWLGRADDGFYSSRCSTSAFPYCGGFSGASRSSRPTAATSITAFSIVV